MPKIAISIDEAPAPVAPHPARITVYVELPEGMLVEIDALAVMGG